MRDVIASAQPGTKQIPRPAHPVLALVVCAAIVLVVRSLLVAQAHSPTWDIEPQMRIGLRMLSGEFTPFANDPHFGAALVYLPLWLIGCRGHEGPAVLLAQPISVDAILCVTAVWKSLLFVPAVLTAFLWARALYGSAAGWLAAVLLVADPNLGGLIPVGTVDIPAAEASFIALYLFWRYTQKPIALALVQAIVATGTAVMIKHNAAIAVLAIGVMATVFWATQLWKRRMRMRAVALHVAAAIGIFVLIIWALTFFDLSIPRHLQHSMGGRCPRLPAGSYIESFMTGLGHNQVGHPAYLLGQTRTRGWWYYFPVLYTYKVPLGMAVVLGLALATLCRRRPGAGEIGLLVPIVIAIGFMVYASINTGFRHFMPAYILLFPLCGRAIGMTDIKAVRIVCWIAAGATSVHALAWHPNYLAYVNAPRTAAYLDISDSNVDWGQGLKQVAWWLDTHPTGEPVYLRYFGRGDAMIHHYLGDRVRILQPASRPPGSGILIISPVFVAGVYYRDYSFLKEYEPTDRIGDTLLVFNLQDLHRWPGAKGSTTRPAP